MSIEVTEMLTQERYQTILQLLNERDAVTVAELSSMLGISESTIRRDLNSLAEMGKLKKVFGGATAISATEGVTETTFETRETEMSEEKTAIARYAATLVLDGDFVFIDAGTTTYRLIDFLTNTKASYITNGVAHARKLVRRGFDTYIIPGRIKATTEAIVGANGIGMISRFNFTKAFVGTNGIDLKAGFTTTEIDEGQVKEAVVEHSYMTFVLADRTKFRRIYPIKFAEMKKCCVITDAVPDPKYLDATVIKEVTK